MGPVAGVVVMVVAVLALVLKFGEWMHHRSRWAMVGVLPHGEPAPWLVIVFGVRGLEMVDVNGSRLLIINKENKS